MSWLILFVCVIFILPLTSCLRSVSEDDLQDMRDNFYIIQEDLEQAAQAALPELIEIRQYNEGRSVDQWKSFPSTEEIFDLDRDQYDQTTAEALKIIWGLGLKSVSLRIEYGELSFSIDEGTTHWLSYIYTYDPTLSRGYWEELADNWYFQHKKKPHP